MSYSIALVGAGPTAIYSVQTLLERSLIPSAITIFERQRQAGRGTPYSANWCDPIMLANIASIEIPPLPQSLVEWLEGQTDTRLASFGIERGEIDERGFYPRLVIGEYLAAQLSTLVDRARSMGVKVEVRTQSVVTDVIIAGEKIQLKVTGPRKTESDHVFDYVILATGHQWPPDPELRPGYFTSPWPASALNRIRNCAVGIRGTSLTAIDAAVALADQHGAFVPADGDELQYSAQPATENFSVTLFSRKGILPEADFYHPIPYEPLLICNAATMRKLVEDTESEGLLDAAFELFRQEMTLVDANYVDDFGLRTCTLEEFCVAYFDPRAQADPFEWARENLEEAVVNADRQFTVAWRYAILRMHEVFGMLPPHLNAADFDRFADTLKPVFVDNYATVPHESVKRLLALHASGKLVVNKLEERVHLDTHSPSQGAILIDGKNRVHFPAFIEATGQPVLSAKDFPFPSLLRQGAIQDAKGNRESEAKRGIAIDTNYHPIAAFESSDRLFCLSLPFLLGQHPFAQGITSSAEMAETVADAIQSAELENTTGMDGIFAAGSDKPVPSLATDRTPAAK